MRLILDFDDVIFNAQSFKELMFFYLEEKGIKSAREKYENIRQSRKVFSVMDYLETLGVKEGEREGIYEGVMIPCAWLTNKEVVRIIEELGKENVFILSQGELAFQMDKIERSLGDKVLGSHIIVVPESKKEEIQKLCELYKDEEIIFVDDKVEFLNDIPLPRLPNLKTVLFDEQGLQTLYREIQVSKK